MNNTFTAIDFETAQGKHWSICQVGLVRVENGLIKDKINNLVCPHDNYYFYRNIQVHKITPEHTKDAPTFDAVWHEIRPYIQNQTVVAHNGSFDFSCLDKTLHFYGLETPAFDKRCTYQIYKKKLNLLCEEYSIALNHHEALSDALACAELYLRYLRS